MLGFVKRYAALHHDLSRRLVSNAALLYDPTVVALAKGVVVGRQPPLRADSRPRALRRVLREGFPGIPAAAALNPTTVPYRDGVEALLEAFERSGGATGAPLLAALARLELDSPTGRIRLDAHRQAIGPNYLSRVATDAKGKPAVRTLRVVPNVEQTFGGYFRPGEPPPSQTSRLREADAAAVGAMSTDPRIGHRARRLPDRGAARPRRDGRRLPRRRPAPRAARWR